MQYITFSPVYHLFTLNFFGKCVCYIWKCIYVYGGQRLISVDVFVHFSLPYIMK